MTPGRKGEDVEHASAAVATGENEQDNPPQTPVQHETNSALLEPYRYINSVPGKDVRGKLIDCFQIWLRVPSSGSDDGQGKGEDILASVKEVVGNLHNASLLIDDIEDNSKLRRGIPVAHHIFGVAPVINCANYVYFLALEKCHMLKNTRAMNVFVGELLNLHRGQGLDISWRDSGKCPTEEQYCDMVIDKTGGLFRLAVGLLQSFATTCLYTDFTPLVNRLALYFQIRDDFINLADSEYMKSKSYCEDLTEGKFSFPIIHCVRSNPTDTRLLSILKQRTEDVDVKKYAQGLMRDAGSLTYTREKCARLREEIVEEIESLGGNAPLLRLIEMLHVQIQGLEADPLGKDAPPPPPVALKAASVHDTAQSGDGKKTPSESTLPPGDIRFDST